MRSSWEAVPWWMRVLCVLGVPWYVGWLVVGVPLLVTEGPGLPLIAVGFLGVVPWVLVVVRSDR